MSGEQLERTLPGFVREIALGTGNHPDRVADHAPVQLALGRIAQAFASGVDPREMLNEVAGATAFALDADIAIIRAIAADGESFVVTTAHAGPAVMVAGLLGSYSVISDAARALEPGEAVSTELTGERAARLLASNERWDLQHLGSKHLLIVPLYAYGLLTGRLDLIRTRPDEFPPSARTTVLPFAASAALALRDQLVEQESEDQRVLQTVMGLHQSVEQLADPDTILQAVAELVVREPGCARCYAMLWNADRGEFIPVAVAGLDPHLVDILKLITLSPNVVPAFDQMIHSSRPLVIPDAAKSTLLPASLVRALGIRAAMIVPLRGRRHQTIGVLLLDQADEDIKFTERQVSVMGGMSRHLSTLIENAILFEEVRTSSESMAVINEIAIQLAMLTDEESLFRQLNYQLGSVVDATHFALGLLTPDRRALDVRYAVDGQVVPGAARMLLGADPISTVATSGRYELVGTRDGGDSSPWLAEVGQVEQVHSHMTVPITVGRNVIGAMSVQSPFRNAYGPRDVELMSSVALHTGIALENARLYRIVQSRGDRRAVVLDEVIQRQELERKQLVENIHDDTLQALAACLYRLDRAQEAVEQLSRDETLLDQITDVRENLSENIARLRKRIFALRPATLDRFGLEPALRDLLNTVSSDHGLLAEIETELPGRLVADDEMLVFRVIQEAVAHIHNRGGASRVRIRLRHQDNAVAIAIHDDAAIESSEETRRAQDQDVGLLALIERAELAGGHMRVAHRSGGGSLMQITVPGRLRQTDRFQEELFETWRNQADDPAEHEHAGDQQDAPN